MLEFIVLGQIPGTTIQITFEQVILTGLLLGMSFELIKMHKKRNLLLATKQLIQQISL